MAAANSMPHAPSVYSAWLHIKPRQGNQATNPTGLSPLANALITLSLQQSVLLEAPHQKAHSLATFKELLVVRRDKHQSLTNPAGSSLQSGDVICLLHRNVA